MSRSAIVLSVLLLAVPAMADKPPLDADVIFTERHPGVKAGHYYSNFGYACTNVNEWLYGDDGARLCRLNPQTGQLTVLLEDAGGGIRDPQVSYDAKRILFSYRKGGTHHFNLYEINVDGAGLRQITNGDWDDVEPCYLPDGGIAFCSSRCKRYVMCWYAPVAVMFRCEADGSAMRMLSSNSVTENTPAILPDGRILYTRWEYVNRDAVSFHHLWTMNPDGTEQQVYFGNQTPGGVFIDAQPIPQSRDVVFIDAGYHGTPEHAGQVKVVSELGGPNATAMVKVITPQGGFRDPYPISPHGFLVARENSLMLLDDAGATTPLYAGRQMVHEPRLLKPRVREPLIPARADLSQNTATLFVADVYQGRNMEGIKRGDVKKLLVLEDLPKPANYHGGGSTPIAHGGTWSLKRIIGTIPVAADGSAYFEVPPMRSIYLALLDANDRSIKQMRSFMTLQPGEQRGCVGCHETRIEPPPSRPGLTALQRGPCRIEPLDGVPDVIDFPRDIQPVLDRHCVRCHNAEKRAGGVVLTGDRGPTYSLAYYNLMLHRQVTDGAGYGWEGVHNAGGRPVGNDVPYAMYSSASPLMDKIGGHHHDAKLTTSEQTLVRLWIDTAAQYAGTYAALGTGQIGAWWHNNEPVREMADAWPTTAPARDAVERRCAACHGNMLPRFVTDQIPVDEFGDLEGWQRPTSRFSRHTIYNLTNPEKSLALMAPLAKAAGGYAVGKPEKVVVKEDRAHAPKAVGHPVVFESADDSDYRKILAHVRAAGQRLDEIKRFDMPGFKPSEQYAREMKRYGLLPADFDLAKDPINVYGMDRKYWQSLWANPETINADGVTRIPDVIYGRKFGMALTMDVLRPKNPNKAAVVWAVSGGFKSDHDDIAGPEFVKYMSALLDRGYTVFAVVHGSNPKFDLREVSADMHRAVRFIRYHAGDFAIDPRRIGISGASAGGVISLWLGTQGGPGDPAAEDPIDRESSEVQAVACFYPGVDWVHWEADGSNCLARTRKLGLIDGFRFRDFDPVKMEYVEETDPKKIDEILAAYSPINHVSAKSAPTFIIHGDKDVIVRVEQARMMVAKLQEAGVAAELVIKQGAGHSWPGQDQDLKLFADWYDKHLR